MADDLGTYTSSKVTRPSFVFLAGEYLAMVPLVVERVVCYGVDGISNIEHRRRSHSELSPGIGQKDACR